MLTTGQLLGFLKSNNEATAMREILVQQGQQTNTLFALTVVTAAFLPLSFCTLVCCLLSMI